jgi:hypothetical protein
MLGTAITVNHSQNVLLMLIDVMPRWRGEVSPVSTGSVSVGHSN